MAIKRPFLILTALLLFGLASKGCWGISIDVAACIELKMTTSLFNCALKYPSDDNMDFFKGCVLVEGHDACMDCLEADTEELISDGTLLLDDDDKRMQYKFFEFMVSLTLESLVDCIFHDQDINDFAVECMFSLIVARAMSRITTITQDYFQHPDYVDCWARGTLTGVKECADLLPESQINLLDTERKRGNKDYALCVMRYSINATVDC